MWELLITFLGVFLAFTLDRAIDMYYNRRDRRDLLRDLHNELEETKGKLTGAASMLYPDIWDSAISSGQIRLLKSEQVTKLARVYRRIKGTQYEAMRLRDAAEDYRKMSKTPSPDASVQLHARWLDYSIAHKKREEETRKMIEEILNEKWWNC